MKKCLEYVNFIFSLILLAQTKADPTVFYNEDEVPVDFGEERSLNFVNVQLPSKQTQRETSFQFNSAYIPPTYMDYYSKPMHYLSQNPAYAYNAPLFPAPGYYTPNTYVEPFIKPSQLSSFEAISKPSTLAAASTPSIVFIQPNRRERPTLSKPMPEQNLTQLLNYLINWNSYNAPAAHQEHFEENQLNKDKISALLAVPDEKPVMVLSNTNKPENVAGSNPGPPSSDILLENLIKQLLNRRRSEEQLGAFYFRNSLLNRK